MNTTDYEDSGITCDANGILIKRYYPWGAKRISYSAIRAVDVLPLKGLNRVRRWRLWGTGDFIHWWNWDGSRPKKTEALVLNTGHHVRPTITPDDPQAVQNLIKSHLAR